MGEIFERAVPSKPLEWTGERLTTATAGQVEIEHLHRYFLARNLCRGLDILDVAAGEGYGTALLAQVARSATGAELSAEAVAHAAAAYHAANLRYLQGDARSLPMDDASVDVVVSFETIEHFYEHDQFLAEVRRVLRPGGRFIVSSPERDVYSPSGSDANPYHARELSRAEFSALLNRSFANVHLLGQRPILGSLLLSDDESTKQMLTFEKRGKQHFECSNGLPRPIYFIAIASDQPVSDVPNSCYIETAEIGAVLAAADGVPALHALVNAAETARLAAETARLAAENERSAARNEIALCIAQANEQAESYRQQLVVAGQASQDHADRARIAIAEAAAACAQRDIARIAARRAAASSEGRWQNELNMLQQRADEAQRRSQELEERVAELEHRADEWQRRYFQLRGRLEAILRRSGILRVSRLVPARVRQFVRERLLRGPRL
jgi:SAM-dependent methyltransferase